jgi:hypothetical protein
MRSESYILHAMQVLHACVSVTHLTAGILTSRSSVPCESCFVSSFKCKSNSFFRNIEIHLKISRLLNACQSTPAGHKNKRGPGLAPAFRRKLADVVIVSIYVNPAQVSTHLVLLKVRARRSLSF